MKIKDNLEGEIVVIELNGTIMGGEDSTLFHGMIHEYINLNKNRFIINLDKVDWTNSLGLGMLIAGQAAVKKVEGRLALCNITNIENLLAITRLTQVFEIFDSLDEARKAFGVN